ncbi:putative cysteine-rich repeat secretory protein 36 [Nymphaea thermarum]|nr:putative cysteine-rich repeat secretory protein 36 [Nymphaea thermarum]
MAKNIDQESRHQSAVPSLFILTFSQQWVAFYLAVFAHLFLVAVLLFAAAAMAYSIQALPSTGICYEGLNKTTDKTILLKYRDRILLSLAADVSVTGFAAASAGQPPQQQYGLAMCLGSSSQEACRSCMSFSRLRLDDFDCESSTFWGESCFLRLSSVNVTGVMDNQMLVFSVSSGGNASDNAALYDQMLKNFLNNLTFVTLTSGPSQTFAEGEIGFNSTSKIHGHVQCRRDISMANCSSCLAKLTESFIQENLAARGTRAIFCSESCVIRYEMESLAAIPPSALPPPIPGTNQTSSNPSSKHPLV